MDSRNKVPDRAWVVRASGEVADGRSRYGRVGVVQLLFGLGFALQVVKPARGVMLLHILQAVKSLDPRLPQKVNGLMLVGFCLGVLLLNRAQGVEESWSLGKQSTLQRTTSLPRGGYGMDHSSAEELRVLMLNSLCQKPWKARKQQGKPTCLGSEDFRVDLRPKPRIQDRRC